jgi:putative nucleotidyltransferase with HDIG domain
MLGAIKEKNFLHPFVLWLILLLWYLIFANYFFSIPQSKVENLITEQSFWLFNQMPKEASEITIVAIDEASRRHLNLKWPWDRSVTANLIRRIASYSPKVIGLDIIFAGKSQPEEDQKLVSALQSHPRVILGYVQYKNSYEKPLHDFINAASAVGFVNKPLHMGLVTKTRSFDMNNQKETVFSLEMEILISYLGLDKSKIRINQNGIFLKEDLFIPGSQGNSSINYLAHPIHLKIIPAYSVLQQKINPLDFRNKIVLVGATDPLIHDEFPTPIGIFPGVTIVANSLLMILSKRFLCSASTAQNVFLCFAFGFVVLLMNRRFRFLRNTLFTLVLLMSAYIIFVYLRALDFHFAYLSILFSGMAAYAVSNLFKYVNLIYLSNHLKNLAIIDPVTGFYSLRFFMLQVDEKFQSNEDFAFVALRLGEYRQLTLKLNFEQLTLLNRLFGDYLKSQVNKHFKDSIFSRVSNDTFGIMIQRAGKEEIETYCKAFTIKANELDWKLEEETIRITLQGCLIHRSKTTTGRSHNLMCRMETLFTETKEGQFLVEELEAIVNQGSKTRYQDILDFIAYDWEERNKELEQSLRTVLDVNKRLDQLSQGSLTALARAIDAKSEWTAGHSERVTQLAVKLGHVVGLSKEELDNLYRGGLLHDIGKIGTPASFINKNSKLTDEEYSVICKHPRTGLHILEPIEVFSDLLPIVEQHHEKFDGSGYPEGLAGEAIAFGARILAVADVFDALSSDRPYRLAMKPETVLRIIKEGSGSHFDPRVVAALSVVMK